MAGIEHSVDQACPGPGPVSRMSERAGKSTLRSLRHLGLHPEAGHRSWFPRMAGRTDARLPDGRRSQRTRGSRGRDPTVDLEIASASEWRSESTGRLGLFVIALNPKPLAPCCLAMSWAPGESPPVPSIPWRGR